MGSSAHSGFEKNKTNAPNCQHVPLQSLLNKGWPGLPCDDDITTAAAPAASDYRDDDDTGT